MLPSREMECPGIHRLCLKGLEAIGQQRAGLPPPGDGGRRAPRPGDNRILEAALAAGADVVVTGDRHLSSLGEHFGIRLLSLSGFLLQLQTR